MPEKADVFMVGSVLKGTGTFFVHVCTVLTFVFHSIWSNRSKTTSLVQKEWMYLEWEPFSKGTGTFFVYMYTVLTFVIHAIKSDKSKTCNLGQKTRMYLEWVAFLKGSGTFSVCVYSVFNLWLSRNKVR